MRTHQRQRRLAPAVCIDALEARLSLSADFPADQFATADKPYIAKIDSSLGWLPVQSVQWNLSVVASKPTPGDFTIQMPAGPSSATLFGFMMSGKRLPSVEIRNDLSTSNQSTWKLEDVFIKSFIESTGGDGGLVDEVQFSFLDLSRNSLTGKITQSFRTSDGATGTWSYDFGSLVQAAADGDAAFTTDAVAIDPSVRQTLELGHGQMPISNFSAGGFTSGSKSAAKDSTGTIVDGLNGLAIAQSAATGKHYAQSVFTQRDAAGNATQRWVHSDVVFNNYSMFDTVLDDQPRSVGFAYQAAKVQSISYGYDTTSGAMLTPVSTGWDFKNSVAYNPDTLSAYVVPPLAQTRSSALSSLQIHFSQPVSSFPVGALSFEGLTSTGLTLTSSPDGTVWTLGNLAPQQSADGRYAVKLLALGSGIVASSGAALIGSTGQSWTLDQTPPSISSSAFSVSNPVGAPPQSLTFGFDEPTQPTSADGTVPILIRLSSTGAVVVTLSGRFDADHRTLRASLPTPLADGRYSAVVPAGAVADAAGNMQAADVKFPFFVLAGDADHNASVEFNDLLVLAKHYGQTGHTFAQGNFNYSADGAVDFNDLLILAKRYGTTLPAAAATDAFVAAATPTAATREHRSVAASVLA